MTCAALVVPAFWLPKFTLPGERLPTVAVPVRETLCGLPVALSLIEIVPVAVPFPAGVNVTEMLQLAPAARDAAQLLVWPKAPPALMLKIVKLAVPVLVRVTV